MNPKVDFFFNKAGNWQSATELLRQIVLDCGLTEELKWGVPCYTLQKTNVVLIHHFKAYCALLFHKGVLLNDSHKILIQQTENVQVARQMRFSNANEILELEPIIKAYILEAIEVEKSGVKPQLKTTEEFKMPEEFSQFLADNEAFKAAFEKLTPGRQRGYLLHFSQPKQAKTRVSRIENAVEKILNEKGLDD